MRSIRQLISVLFIIYTVVAILLSFSPLGLKARPVLLQNLISGNDQNFVLPGSAQLEPFKPYLSKNGFYSYIMDHPFNDSPYAKNEERAEEREFFWLAQNYFIPAILNRSPAEERAIIFCSNDEIAESRMRETGYAWVQKLGDGKGIAVKKV